MRKFIAWLMKPSIEQEVAIRLYTSFVRDLPTGEIGAAKAETLARTSIALAQTFTEVYTEEPPADPKEMREIDAALNRHW